MHFSIIYRYQAFILLQIALHLLFTPPFKITNSNYYWYTEIPITFHINYVSCKFGTHLFFLNLSINDISFLCGPWFICGGKKSPLLLFWPILAYIFDIKYAFISIRILCLYKYIDIYILRYCSLHLDCSSNFALRASDFAPRSCLISQCLWVWNPEVTQLSGPGSEVVTETTAEASVPECLPRRPSTCY